MKDPGNRVLIIEDDRDIADVVALNVEDLGLETDRAADGESGLRKALEGGYALIILDLMLPGLDGVSVCSRIRQSDPVTPIMMLTARGEEMDRVIGLEIGADDYMTKPFSLRELTARIRALLRRARAGREEIPPPPLEFRGLRVDFEKRKVSREGSVVELTVKEFDLLALFIRYPGRAFSRADLLELVWGFQFEGYEHTVNSHINRLRGKIEPDPARPTYLQTVWGIGYRFAESAEGES